ncbi:hypothetical protein [Parasitella parasitica]|uniref:Uncharacterized protein n=1 Tax=Parasitella parasitica TaxID=35722 RepID=A0A0B7NUG6_9FUNG|nr:hypothetical protein [Parasitella parasitica]
MLKILKKLSEDAPSEDARQSWALVIAKDDELVKNGLSKRFYQKPDDRIWFDSIQICRVDSLDQLKAELCSLHVSVQEQKNDILDIIEYEKHGQPPSIVLVNGLFAYLKMDPALDNELQYSATR